MFRWSAIATHLPGRTDNEIKNFWNTHLKKKLLQMGIDPVTHQPRTDHLDILAHLPQLLAIAANNLGATSLDLNIRDLLNPSLFDMNMSALMSHSDATQIAKFQLLQNILQVLSPNAPTSTTSMPQNIDPFYAIQLSDYLKINPQHLNNLQELAMNVTPSASSLPPFSTHDFRSPTYQTLNLDNDQASKAFSEQDITRAHGVTVGKEEYLGFESVPALVPASPEHLDQSYSGNGQSPGANVNIGLGNSCNLKQKQSEHLSSSDPTSTATTIDANWPDFMDDEASGCYWKEIIE